MRHCIFYNHNFIFHNCDLVTFAIYLPHLRLWQSYCSCKKQSHKSKTWSHNVIYKVTLWNRKLQENCDKVYSVVRKNCCNIISHKTTSCSCDFVTYNCDSSSGTLFVILNFISQQINTFLPWSGHGLQYQQSPRHILNVHFAYITNPLTSKRPWSDSCNKNYLKFSIFALLCEGISKDLLCAQVKIKN